MEKRVLKLKVLKLKDIKEGMTFCYPHSSYPHNELMTVTGIKYNENAGEPVKDMWGGVVGEEPFASVEAVGSITGEKSSFCVYSEDIDSIWRLWVNSPEERIEAIYADRRKRVIETTNRCLGEVVKEMQEIHNYPAQLDKDDKMKLLIELVAKAMIEVF